MLRSVLSLLLFNALLVPNVKSANTHDFYKPLLLTPYLKDGNIQKARDMAATNIGGITSYTGFFTVNENCGNNLFFWFILAEENFKDAPLLLWLSGGPGGTSLFGLFQENGPWTDIKTGFVQRKFRWTQRNNVLYVDQPVGTGFSYTEKGCYAKNLTVVVQDMTSALFQFFKLFPEFQGNKFFMSGESYAGHYVPAIAEEIDKKNADSEPKINLKGIVLGNPFLDTRCIYTADYLYQLGIIDNQQRLQTIQDYQKYVSAINAGNYKRAKTLDGYNTGYEFIIKNKFPSVYNILYDINILSEFPFQILVRDIETRKKIHVGTTEFNVLNDLVYDYLYPNDGLISISPKLEYLLRTNKYIVGFYAGQLDVVCLYSSLPCVLKNLQWSGSGLYLNATRHPWYVSGRLAGWFKVAGNLFEVAVRGSGHIAPADQPQAVLDLITAAVADEPGTQLLGRLKTTP